MILFDDLMLIFERTREILRPKLWETKTSSSPVHCIQGSGRFEATRLARYPFRGDQDLRELDAGWDHDAIWCGAYRFVSLTHCQYFSSLKNFALCSPSSPEIACPGRQKVPTTGDVSQLVIDDSRADKAETQKRRLAETLLGFEDFWIRNRYRIGAESAGKLVAVEVRFEDKIPPYAQG